MPYFNIVAETTESTLTEKEDMELVETPARASAGSACAGVLKVTVEVSACIGVLGGGVE